MNDAPIARIPEGSTRPDGTPIPCTMFALCGNDATLLIPHPVLDYVPSCQRCADHLGYDTSGPLPIAQLEWTEQENPQ